MSTFTKNIYWSILASLSSKIISPVFSILVARILIPEDYGVIAIAVSISAFFSMIKDFGIRNVIIVKSDDYDYTEMQFTIQFIIATISFFIIWFSKSSIALYFQIEELRIILPLTVSILFIQAVEDALLTRHYKNNEYKILFFRQLIPAIINGVSALSLAYMGFKVYSLVFSMLIGSIASTLFLVVYNKWLPAFDFNLSKIKELFNFGKHLVLQNFSGFLALQLDSLIVAKQLGDTSTGIYKMAMKFSQLIPDSILGQYQQVLFTEVSKNKNDKTYLAHRYNQFVNYTFLFNLLYVIIVYIVTPYIVPVILGNKWSGIIEPIRLLVIMILSSYLVNANNFYAQILGFYKIYTYFSIIRSTCTALAVLIASFYSLEAVLYTWVAIGLVSNFVNFIIFNICQDTIYINKIIYFMFFTVWFLYAYSLANSSFFQ